MFDFESPEGLQEISHKLNGVTPQSFASAFSQKEKVTLLLFLVNTAHDLEGFR